MNFFIGVDGGGTKCTARLEDEAGQLLSRETSGPANIRLSIDQTWESINSCLMKLLQPLSLSLDQKEHYFHVGMGLAGCESNEAYQAFIERPHRFDTLAVTFDSHTACLGAHCGADGAIIIAGTGSVGFQIEGGQTTKVGGLGFPQDDMGSGAWLGLEAVRVTFQCLDKRLPISALAQAIYAHFSENQNYMIDWTNHANSTAFATLAPFVVEQAKAGDAAAIRLMQEAARAIDRIGEALTISQFDTTRALPCSLVGSVAFCLEPYLGEALRSRLRPYQTSPDAGAVFWVRQQRVEKNEPLRSAASVG